MNSQASIGFRASVLPSSSRVSALPVASSVLDKLFEKARLKLEVMGDDLAFALDNPQNIDHRESCISSAEGLLQYSADLGSFISGESRLVVNERYARPYKRGAHHQQIRLETHPTSGALSHREF